MAERVYLIVPDSLAEETLVVYRKLGQIIAGRTGAEVALTLASGDIMEDDDVESLTLDVDSEILPDELGAAAPMAPAPFVWREDGRPDWGTMWSGFCELALYGGPPHRGEDQALRAASPEAAPNPELDAITEIQRGIWETTGLVAEPVDAGWLAVACDSPRMAAWLCATILLENVEARCEGDRLLVPASGSFELKDQVKSVITVVAKTHHYWQAHLAARATSV
jgi:sirohydrochlorin cobaltochelatase